MTVDEARALTARIKQSLENLIALVVEAYQGEADRVLGYDSWQAYVQAEFPNLPRMERLERNTAAKELVEVAGMTYREVGATLGVGAMTVHAALNGRSGRRVSAVAVAEAPDPDDEVDLPVPNGTQRSTPRPKLPSSPERYLRQTKSDAWAAAEALVAEGAALREAARQTDIPHTTLRGDLRIRQIRATQDPSFPIYPSLRNHQASIACQVEPAAELIYQVELSIARLLGTLYTLNEFDQRRLRRVLEDGLNYLERYPTNEQSGS